MFSLISKYNLIWKMALFLGYSSISNHFKIDSSGFGPVSLVDLGAEILVTLEWGEHILFQTENLPKVELDPFKTSFLLFSSSVFRQFNHSASVIFLSLLTSQYFGSFLPHFRRSL